MARSRRGIPGVSPLVASLAALVLIVGACSAQPVSEVGAGPDTPQASEAASAGSEPSPAATATPSGSATAASSPTSAPALNPPDKPTGTAFAIVSEQPADGGGVRQTHRITWQAADGEATAFPVFGVKTCLRASKANNGTPCVVKGMKIPRDALVQLAKAGGADRSIDVDWVVPKSGKPPYSAVLIRATNDAGDSIFTIVHSEDVCWRC